VEVHTYKVTAPAMLTTFVSPNSFKLNCDDKFAEVISANKSNTRFRVFIEDTLINTYGVEDTIEQLLKYFNIKSVDSDDTFVEICRKGIEELVFDDHKGV
jgi:hypothetical protein